MRRPLRIAASWVTMLALLTLTACAGDDSAKPGGGTSTGPSTVPPVSGGPTNLKSFVGCYAAGATSSGVGCGHLSTLGNAAEDATFTSEVQYQGGFWGGVPAIVYVFNECSPAMKNAIATPDRSINFGYYLFRSLIGQYPDGLPIAGVLAHEWGHQVQFAYGWMNPNQSTVRPTELEADAFSGYYMGLGKQFAWSFINSYFSAVYSFGEYNFNSPMHHGTPQERLAAARLGFDTAVSAASLGRPLSYAQLHSIFTGVIGTAVIARMTTASVPDDSEHMLSAEQVQHVAAIAEGRSTGSEGTVPGSLEFRRALFPRP
jgi:hypothetical protein